MPINSRIIFAAICAIKWVLNRLKIPAEKRHPSTSFTIGEKNYTIYSKGFFPFSSCKLKHSRGETKIHFSRMPVLLV